MAVKGIDVSSHQGQIQWDKVKAAGYEFAIVRAGWSWYEGGMNVDKLFHDHMKGAIGAGLDVGVFLYSYDHSPEAARIAAKRLLETVSPYRLTYPVYFDMEYESFNLTAGKALNAQICEAFLSEMQNAGYYAGLYASTDFMNNHIDMTKLAGYDVWAAQYAGQCTYRGGYGMWQHGVKGVYGKQGKDYTIYGTVPGVSANCDVDLCYKDYPRIIRGAGLNGFPKPAETPQDTPKEETNSFSTEEIRGQFGAVETALDGLKKLCGVE